MKPDIFRDGFIELSLKYARAYLTDRSAFVSCFKKFKSVRSCCQMIVSSYKSAGAYDELEGDFKEWAERNWPENPGLLNDTMRVIYSISK